MKVYKIYKDDAIEAKTEEQALVDLEEQNSIVARKSYTTDLEEARKIYDANVAYLKENACYPVKVSGPVPFYTFRGVILESAEVDDDSIAEDMTAEQMYNEGYAFDLIDAYVQGFEQ